MRLNEEFERRKKDYDAASSAILLATLSEGGDADDLSRMKRLESDAYNVFEKARIRLLDHQKTHSSGT